jgi:cobalt-zinc-cadmium efflux system outer membrane protein
MRTLVAVLTLLLAAAAPAQGASPAAPLTLERALALGPDASASVLSARAAVAGAQRDATRVASDPASLRVDRIAAANARAYAERALAAALATNRANVASAFFDALEADAAVDVARLDAAILRQTLEAELTRLQAGAATDLDAAKARNAVAAAEATLRDAITQSTLARNALASLIGTQVADLSEPAELPELEPVDAALARADQLNAPLTAARNAQALARAQLEATDNDFSSRSEIQNAQDALQDAVRHVGEVERTLELSVRGAHANAEAARTSLDNARAADATARKDLDAARARLDAGAISPLAYRSSELTRRQAAQALAAARHALVLRIYTLEEVVAGG